MQIVRNELEQSHIAARRGHDQLLKLGIDTFAGLPVHHARELFRECAHHEVGVDLLIEALVMRGNDSRAF